MIFRRKVKTFPIKSQIVISKARKCNCLWDVANTVCLLQVKVLSVTNVIPSFQDKIGACPIVDTLISICTSARWLTKITIDNIVSKQAHFEQEQAYCDSQVRAHDRNKQMKNNRTEQSKAYKKQRKQDNNNIICPMTW